MILPRPVRGVVFDMDGLLVDSEAIFRDLMMEVAAERGHELPLDVFLRMVGLPHAASRKVAISHFGEGFDYDPWLAEVWARAHVHMEAGVPVKDGAQALLNYLHDVAMPCALATSSSHSTVQRQLGPTGLLTKLQALVAAGDYARGKPHPEPFLAAAESLGVEPAHCLALEDSHNGVRAAHAAGMMTIMVPDLLPATDEIRALCVGVAASLQEVQSLLEAHPAA